VVEISEVPALQSKSQLVPEKFQYEEPIILKLSSSSIVTVLFCELIYA